MARTAFWALTYRSGPTPVVPYQPPRSTSRVSDPGGTWYCALGIERPFCSVNRSAPYIGNSTPVTQTSPSPCAACASPQLNSAPSTWIGRDSVVPRVSCPGSLLPPEAPRGMIGTAPAPARPTPPLPPNGGVGGAP